MILDKPKLKKIEYRKKTMDIYSNTQSSNKTQLRMNKIVNIVV